VRTLTFHPDRPHPLRDRVDARLFSFGDVAALADSLDGVTHVYNTYWVRFDHGATTFADAVDNSRALFFAARHAGVELIIHVSIANPRIESPLPYYRGKARVERALAEVGIPYSIVRPTLVFGGERDVLTNNIAWILRRAPVFAVPGDGRYRVQPVHVDDLARIAIEQSAAGPDAIVDAAGPEAMAFDELVGLIREAVGSRAPIVHVPAVMMAAASRGLGLLVGDVVLTTDEIKGLMAGLLVSHAPALGRISFGDWVARSELLGAVYANELERHFALT